MVFGSTRYPLLKQGYQGKGLCLQITEVQYFDNNSCSAVDNLSLSIVGRGESDKEAIDDWMFQFHRLFQTLKSLRSFEMTPQQKNQWDTIKRILDYQKYLKYNPYCYRMEGRITNILEKDREIEITWLGSSITKLSYSSTPSDFVLFEIDEWFEATVQKDFETGNVDRILDARRIPCPYLSEEQDKELERML